MALYGIEGFLCPMGNSRIRAVVWFQIPESTLIYRDEGEGFGKKLHNDHFRPIAWKRNPFS